MLADARVAGGSSPPKEKRRVENSKYPGTFACNNADYFFRYLEANKGKEAPPKRNRAELGLRHKPPTVKRDVGGTSGAGSSKTTKGASGANKKDDNALGDLLEEGELPDGDHNAREPAAMGGVRVKGPRLGLR